VLTEDEFLVMLATDEFPTSHSADSPWVNKESHPSEKLDTGLAGSGQEETDSKEALHESISQLNSMIGLSGVKAEVNRLVSFLRIQRERRKHGLRESGQTLHFVFTGNPGTGKTTVARIISKILYGFGLLKTSKVVECDRSDLIGGFLGQTAIKTNSKIESALDGVLFIDEAYTLAGDALNYGHGDMYGDEAINTLLKRMEDCRDRLVVIVAGYPALMRKFICANPGLESRFTRYICFEDYNVSDLCQIFEKFCRDAEYSLSASGRVWASILFTIAYDQRDERFGNARFIRNVFERATSLHSERLADVPEEQITKEMLGTLDGNDLSFEFVKNIDRNLLDVSNARWLGDCPSCGALVRGNAKVIGRHASCGKCNEIFSFPWWTLERDTVPGVPPALG
jgi:SpoVK/Ycf46/Vps4 family AAA+-type ATPase